MTSRDNMRLELRVLGGFDVRCNGEPIRQWTRAGPRQLLKRLVVNERQSIRAEMLAEAFWPDDRSDRGMQRLHQLVYLLRKTLQSASSSAQHPETGVPCLRTDAGVVRLVGARMSRCANLGITYFQLGRYKDAEARFDQALSPELSVAARPTRLALTLVRRAWMCCCLLDLPQAQHALSLARDVMFRAQANGMMRLLALLEGGLR